MFSLQPRGWAIWKKEKEYFLLERKKKLLSSLLYGFSHHPGSLINRDSEKKNSRGCRLLQPRHSGSISHYLAVQWVEREQMQIFVNYTKCVLRQPLFNMCNAFCLLSYAFSSPVPKDQSSKYSVLMESRNKHRMHSNFPSPRSILNWPCWLREFGTWTCQSVYSWITLFSSLSFPSSPPHSVCTLLAAFLSVLVSFQCFPTWLGYGSFFCHILA